MRELRESWIPKLWLLWSLTSFLKRKVNERRDLFRVGEFSFCLAVFVPSASMDSHTAPSARVRGLCVFILCLVAKNEARKHTKGLCPLDSRSATRELSIFPPRGKNVCQHFSSVAKMIAGYRESASGNPKISLLRRFLAVPLPFFKTVSAVLPHFCYVGGEFAQS